MNLLRNSKSKLPGSKVTFTILIILFWLCPKTFSQTFLPSYEPTLGNKKGYVVLKDSSKIEGTFKLINQAKNIKTCIIKDNKGIKHSLKAADIYRVYIMVTGWDKLNSYSEITLNLKDLLDLDLKEAFKPEYYVWEQTVTKKKGKIKVLQLINPGFDSKIKVYRDPSAIIYEGSDISGSQELSYLVQKKGFTTSEKIKKATFTEQFKELFKDCPELTNALKDKMLRWEDFASYVFLYDQLKK